jgi:hypothetical protein
MATVWKSAGHTGSRRAAGELEDTLEELCDLSYPLHGIDERVRETVAKMTLTQGCCRRVSQAIFHNSDDSWALRKDFPAFSNHLRDSKGVPTITTSFCADFVWARKLGTHHEDSCADTSRPQGARSYRPYS